MTSLSDEQLQAFFKKFEERMDAEKGYNIPGAALAIVDGNIVKAEGFGFRNLATQDKVDRKTIFAMGSATKVLTSFMMATQVKKGEFQWDTKVKDISSDYQFPSSFPKSDELKVKDLLGMNTGIDGAISPFADLHTGAWGNNGTLWNDQSSIYQIKNLPFLPVEQQYLLTYKYNNELFATAAYLPLAKQNCPASQLLQAYHHLMRDQVFSPLKMDSSCITGTLSTASENFATSYGLDMSEGNPKTFTKGPISINYIDGVSPSGQGTSNVEDISRFLITLLNEGKSPEGLEVVTPEILRELWNVEGKTFIPRKSGDKLDVGITGYVRYGMGLYVEEIPRKSSTNKIKVLWHGGFLPAWSSVILLIPEKKVGMVILTNGCFGREFFSEMNQELIKLLYGDDLADHPVDAEGNPIQDQNLFIDNKALYDQFLNNLKEVVPKKVSSYTIQPENLESVNFLLGNYEGGWTLDIDQENHLVLFKNGWVYHLYPSKEQPLTVYYTGAANNHRGMRAKPTQPNSWEAAEIRFYCYETEDVKYNIQITGPQIGTVKKLLKPEIPTATKKRFARDNLFSALSPALSAIKVSEETRNYILDMFDGH